MSTYPFRTSRRLHLLGVILAATVSVHAGIAQDNSPAREASEASPTRPGLAADNVRPAERAFLEQAWLLLRQQRRLGELAVGNATSSDVRSHAQQVTGDVRRVAEGLEGLLRKKGIALVPAPEVPTDAYQSISAKSGATFDRSFVHILGELHETTQSLFEQAAAELKDSDLRDFAAAQLPLIRGHRNRMVRLRAAMN